MLFKTFWLLNIPILLYIFTFTTFMYKFNYEIMWFYNTFIMLIRPVLRRIPRTLKTLFIYTEMNFNRITRQQYSTQFHSVRWRSLSNNTEGTDAKTTFAHNNKKNTRMDCLVKIYLLPFISFIILNTSDTTLCKSRYRTFVNTPVINSKNNTIRISIPRPFRRPIFYHSTV